MEFFQWLEEDLACGQCQRRPWVAEEQAEIHVSLVDDLGVCHPEKDHLELCLHVSQTLVSKQNIQSF